MSIVNRINGFNLNIVIPMAGRGTRTEVYPLPKPLIPINGVPMIERAVQSLNIPGQYIFIRRIYENSQWNDELYQILQRATKPYGISPIILNLYSVTEGPACSAMIAEQYINNDLPLIVTNCDQIMHWDSAPFINAMQHTEVDGIVVTYPANTKKNSYVRLTEDYFAVEFAEKEVISEYSLNGIHFWKKGRYFVESTKAMIEKNIRVNNEFYVSLTYNQLIERGMKITIHSILAEQHWAVGTKEDIEKYENLHY